MLPCRNGKYYIYSTILQDQELKPLMNWYIIPCANRKHRFLLYHFSIFFASTVSPKCFTEHTRLFAMKSCSTKISFTVQACERSEET